MKINSLILASALTMLATQALAKIDLTIYNSGLALVKDTRNVVLKKGSQKLNFTNVAANITPQSASINGDGIRSVEQNYDYNLINQANLLDYNLGKKVKTITTNADGKDIIKTAEVIAVNYDTPVLKFDYGYETNFKGRIVFDEIPAAFTAKPSFYSVIESNSEGLKELSLTYLTSGLSWNADYIANITENGLDIDAWATIKNNSGADFNGAKIKVISGTINTQSQRPMPLMAMTKSAAAPELGYADSMNTAQSFGDYYFYDIKAQTSIKNNQSKQVLLFNKEAVKYNKEYQITSPIHIGKNSYKSDFKKLNSKIVFSLKNNQESNLDILLPAGTIRFYEQNNNNTAFIGEANIPQTTTDGEVKLNIGEASDLYAQGKILDINKVSNNISIITAEVSFYNSKKTMETILFKQRLSEKWHINEESIVSKKIDSSTAQWDINIPADSNVTLTYKVRVEH